MSVFSVFSEMVGDFFTPEFYEPDFGIDRRFPSPVSAIFRFFLRFVFLLIPLAWVGFVAALLVQGNDFLSCLLMGLLSTGVSLLLVVGAFLLVMAVESFARIFACLILYRELPRGAENPVDAWITRAVAGRR